MAQAPEFEVPYQFAYAGHEDTYRMAVDLYLGTVLRRVSDGYSLRDVIAADVMRSLQWHNETRNRTHEQDQEGNPARPDQVGNGVQQPEGGGGPAPGA